MRALRLISRVQALRVSAPGACEELFRVETDVANIRGFLAGSMHGAKGAVDLGDLAEHLAERERQLVAIEAHVQTAGRQPGGAASPS